ncbi:MULTISPECIES: alpha/beta hydrolase fold domain-containing protein [Nocardiopsis]|uniref:Esterase n=1 Tax=Nocardiopsis sinuspersici TaxID=501010 RepID=A0A1V3C3G1_9ACTN|nr:MULTISPECIES: alpha/beta hydrolase [Nocardiopsis]OOC55009.1 esterase [Nocardiopsis sinuspersici]
MPSLAVRSLSLLLRVARKRPMATLEEARRQITAPKRDPAPPAWFAERYGVGVRRVGGFDSFTVPPRGRETPERVVLYVHGGSYVHEISHWHWVFVARLADAGCLVEVPAYGLAPRHTHREALPFLEAVHRELPTDAGPLVFAGDSAGAGLALSYTQSLLGEEAGSGPPMPRRLVLISPWVDLTLSHPDIRELDRVDPWLSPVGLRESALAWAGGDDLADPRLSPVNGPMEGLPPTDLHIGTHDLLLPDVRRLRDRLVEAGVAVDLQEEKGAFHVYPLVPYPEGRAARDRIIAALREPRATDG